MHWHTTRPNFPLQWEGKNGCTKEPISSTHFLSISFFCTRLPRIQELLQVKSCEDGELHLPSFHLSIFSCYSSIRSSTQLFLLTNQFHPHIPYSVHSLSLSLFRFLPPSLQRIRDKRWRKDEESQQYQIIRPNHNKQSSCPLTWN